MVYRRYKYRYKYTVIYNYTAFSNPMNVLPAVIQSINFHWGPFVMNCSLVEFAAHLRPV